MKDNLTGTVGTISIGKMTINMRILDTRSVYGRTECLVEPVSGSGQAWVTLGKITVKEGEK
jgi:hypothetical protein